LSTSILSSKSSDLKELGKQRKSSYVNAAPFPFISFENFFNKDYLDDVLKEFPNLAALKAKSHNNAREIKFGNNNEAHFGPKTKRLMHFLNSETFISFLQEVTGIEERLIPDPFFEGGGQHEIKRGGLLKVHSDFNKHPITGLDRRVNVLVYLNKNWKEEYGGNLELWEKDMSKCGAKVAPLFNNLAIFSTTDFSYHGHPDPLMCPDDRSRKSLALYYYSNGRPKEEINPNIESHGTLFKARKNNDADKKAFSLSSYSVSEILLEFIPPIIVKGLKKLLGR